MTAPPLSVVIPSHNRTDLLTLCLRSVAQHTPAGTEVIVVDDASPGGAVGATARAYPSVRVIRLPRRGGFCAASNTGVRAARAAVVELLNDDTEVTAGWAEAALACFADPRVAAVAPLVLRWPGHTDRPILDSAGDDYDLGGFARKRGYGDPLRPAHLSRREVFGASGSSAFYRRDLLRRVGAFPLSFGAYFEDVDLSFRLRRVGTVVFEPRSRVLHRGGESYGPASRRLVERQSCNEERVFWRNLPPDLLLRSLPRHAAVLAGKLVRRWIEGTTLPWAFGRLRAWSEVVACRRHARFLNTIGPLRGWDEERSGAV
jgi:GT2 family glycosyltransferase